VYLQSTRRGFAATLGTASIDNSRRTAERRAPDSPERPRKIYAVQTGRLRCTTIDGHRFK
jgi:hypothetical protein